MDIQQGEALTARGLERRLKRHLKNTALPFAAITLPGLESIAASEIDALEKGCVAQTAHGIVAFSGPMDLLYRANLHCRTVSRILLRITTFTVRSYPELYNKLSKIKWELYCGFNPAITVKVSSRTSRLHHTGNIAESAFCAVRDSMQKLSVTVTEDENSPIAIYLRIVNDECTVSIDSTGELLYKRGVRTATGSAPLRETTAAALLFAAHSARHKVIADVCCGSGAIITEAMHSASNTAPGLRRDFAFLSWPSFKESLWSRLKNEALAAVKKEVTTVFYAGDSDAAAVERCRSNCSTLPHLEQLTIEPANCLHFNADGSRGNSGLIISNLPFGKRVKTSDESIDSFYRNLGTAIRTNCRGWHFAFLVADTSFEKKSGLKARTALSFDNGGIPVRLVVGHCS